MSSSKKASSDDGVPDAAQWAKDAQWIKDTSVRLAGEEAKDRLYEPKHKKKLVRVLTVMAYVFFVSLAAIMLSVYYVFLWNGDQKAAPKYAMQRQVQAKCDNVAAEIQQLNEITAIEEEVFVPTASAAAEENTTWPDSYNFSSDLGRTSTFVKKLVHDEYPYAEND